MIQGVIQRLSIVQQTQTRLVLRELPLLDWAAAFGLIITGLMLSITDFWASSVIAVGIALYFIFAGRVRMIDVDAQSGMMLIHYQTPLRKETVSQIELSEIQRAYLYQGDDGGTQIILVRVDGEELGISVYSDDLSPWKDEIVIAFNAILYEAHKDSESTGEFSIPSEEL